MADGRSTMADRRSRSLNDLVRAQAAGAHANAPDTTANQGANGLQIGFEPARPDVMGMADRSSDDGLAAADSTLFRHCSSQKPHIIACNRAPGLKRPGLR